MRSKLRQLIPAFAATLGILSAASCRGAQLGQEAPPMQITNWARGKLDSSDTNRVRVLLFWETDCDSCRASLPPLIELQNRLSSKGVKFIGICPQTAEDVQKFLTNSQTGPKINFAIGCDPDRTTFNGYMMGFEQTTVPRAFVLDRANHVVWFGHPLAGMERVLDDLIANKFNFESVRKSVEAGQRQEEYFLRAAKTPDDAEVARFGRKIVADEKSNPWLLNNFAWQIEQDTRLKHRDAELARKASLEACEATEWKRPTFVDTYAWALFLKGDAKGAIRFEQQALELVTSNSVLKTRIEQTLQTFTAGSTNSAPR